MTCTLKISLKIRFFFSHSASFVCFSHTTPGMWNSQTYKRQHVGALVSLSCKSKLLDKSTHISIKFRHKRWTLISMLWTLAASVNYLAIWCWWTGFIRESPITFARRKGARTLMGENHCASKVNLIQRLYPFETILSLFYLCSISTLNDAP